MPDNDRDMQAMSDDSLVAPGEMGPHLPGRGIKAEQAESIAVALEKVLGPSYEQHQTSYHRGISSDAHRMALYDILCARIGISGAGLPLYGEVRRIVLNRGLGRLQPALDMLSPERRAPLAALVSEVKQQIGQEIIDEQVHEPARLAPDEEAAVSPTDIVAVLSKAKDALGQAKALAPMFAGKAELLAEELRGAPFSQTQLEVITTKGVEAIDLGSVGRIDQFNQVADLVGGMLDWYLLEQKQLEGADTAEQMAHTAATWKAIGDTTKGVIELGAALGRAASRVGLPHASGKAKDVLVALETNSSALFALKGLRYAGVALAVLDGVSAMLTLASGTASDQDQLDAMVKLGTLGAQGVLSLAGSSFAGPVGMALTLTWEMVKWIGAETHEFHHKFSTWLMGHAFIAMKHHAGELERGGDRLARIATTMAAEQDPDVRTGMHESWCEEARSLGTHVRAFLDTCRGSNHYADPGYYRTLKARFAPLVSAHGSVEEAEASVAASSEVLREINGCFADQAELVAEESDRTGGPQLPIFGS